MDCGNKIEINSDQISEFPCISSKYRSDIKSFIKYQIAKCISQATQSSDKALDILANTMNFQYFKTHINQTEYNIFMIHILPSLCKSSDFLLKFSSNKIKKSFFMKSIFEQLKSNEEERIIVGIKCLKALNDKHREFLHLEVKSLLKNLSTLVRSENDKIKKLSMDFMVSILSNWVGKERETLGMLCIHLLYKIEEEESYIILRLLNCLKILLSKNDIKIDEENYIGKVLLLLSHKDVEVKIQAIETLTLSKDIESLVSYLDQEKFIMEKIMMCLMVNDNKVK